MNDQVCARCVLDTTVPGIRFDESGICQFCKTHDLLESNYPLGDEGKQRLSAVVEKIRRSLTSGGYDSVCGVSGGCDSSWMLYTAVKLGLKPLAVHLDNGWNTEIAVENMRRVTQALGVDLEVVKADWDEFSDLQRSFLKASVSDAEIPTDVAIFSVLHEVAARRGIRYILNGHSFRTEGVAPIGWTYMDARYIRAVQKRFGTRPLRTFRNFGVREVLYYSFVRGIRVVPLLNYQRYDKAEAKRLMSDEMGWQDYGGHHHESTYTKMIQSYLLPTKFGIDKRKTELSAQIRDGRIDRDAALEELAHTYPVEPRLVDEVIDRLGMQREEWEQILLEPRKSFKDYPSYYPLLSHARPLVKAATHFRILPELLYLKYFG